MRAKHGSSHQSRCAHTAGAWRSHHKRRANKREREDAEATDRERTIAGCCFIRGALEGVVPYAWYLYRWARSKVAQRAAMEAAVGSLLPRNFSRILPTHSTTVTLSSVQRQSARRPHSCESSRIVSTPRKLRLAVVLFNNYRGTQLMTKAHFTTASCPYAVCVISHILLGRGLSMYCSVEPRNISQAGFRFHDPPRLCLLQENEEPVARAPLRSSEPAVAPWRHGCCPCSCVLACDTWGASDFGAARPRGKWVFCFLGCLAPLSVWIDLFGSKRTAVDGIL